MTVASDDGAWWFSPDLRRLQETFNRLQPPSFPALDALAKAARVNADLTARMNPLANSAAFRQLTESLYESMQLPAGLTLAADSVRRAQLALLPSLSPALRASVLDISKVLPASFPSVQASSALTDSVGQLAQRLAGTVEQHYDELVEAVEEAAVTETEQVEPDETGLTDFQAWILLRVWVASLVFGWAIEDRLRGVGESQREKRGAMYTDIRNRVIAGVIVAFVAAVTKAGWDALDG